MITMTDSAKAAVRDYIARNDAFKDKSLRIFVQGGGCSGFQYGFTFTERQEGDQVVNLEGFDVVIDPTSLPYVEGSVVDFVDGLQGTGFTVQNPNSSGGCGCGRSFSV